MEKEIKVRKKRFAAFWAVVLLVCSMVLPKAANAVDENGLVSLNEQLAPQAQVRAENLTYLNAAGEGGSSVSCISGGWQTIADYSGEVPNGYEFSRWEVTSISSDVTNAASKYGEAYGNVDYPNSVTVKPVFTLKTYAITYNLDGGTGTMVEQYTVETETFTLTEPTKTGYTFLGWTYDGQTEPINAVEVRKGTTGVLSYTANWSINQYTITFNTDGGDTIDPITQDYNTNVTPPSDPTKEEYIFDGWDQEIPANMPARDMTITAKWKSKYIIEKGTHELTAGVRYQLGNGVTQVSGDTSVYASGAYFYVPADGSYTFS